MDEYRRANLAFVERVDADPRPRQYLRPGRFQGRENKLHELEVGEVGPAAGKTLLHLQCHFGLDTLSWARLGAQVTGVDFSDQATRPGAVTQR